MCSWVVSLVKVLQLRSLAYGRPKVVFLEIIRQVSIWIHWLARTEQIKGLTFPDRSQLGSFDGVASRIEASHDTSGNGGSKHLQAHCDTTPFKDSVRPSHGVIT